MPKHILPAIYRRIALFAFLFCCVAVDTSSGQNVVLQTQASVDAFDPGTTFIAGNLTLSSIGSDPITDISNLSNIEYIGGSLIIESTGLVNLDAFSKLDSIGVDLSLSYDRFLTNIDGLTNLRTVGQDVTIYALDSLVSISGLAGLSRIAGELRIYNDVALPALEGLQNITIIARLSIDGNTILKDVQGLSGLVTVTGDFSIHDNDSLKTLDGLQNLIQVGENLTIQNLPLTSIAALSNLQTVGGNLVVNSTSISSIASLSSLISVGGAFGIGSNPLLTDLVGLPNLQQAGALNVGTNLALKHISGFPNLMTLGGLNLSMNSILEDITGLGHLTSVNGDIIFFNNDGLKSIPGLSNVQAAHSLDVEENNGLKNLDGLSGLTELTGDLYLSLNKLENLHGLSHLANIGGKVVIFRCNKLTNVDGLSSLTSIGGDLTISQNDILGNLDSLLNLVSVQGNLDIVLNNVVNVNGLSSLKSIGGYLRIEEKKLQNVDGLSSLTTIGGFLGLNNQLLSSIDGLGSLTFVGGDFNICCQQYLTDIDSLSDLAYIGGQLIIYSTGLTNMNGFIHLHSIGSLDVHHNLSLTNIDGLKNLEHVKGIFKLFDNPSLAFCCGLSKLMETPGLIEGSINIYQNSTECSSATEITNGTHCGIVTVYNDVNANCTREQEEVGLELRRLLVDPGSYIFLTDYLGRADLSSLPLGSYSMVVDTSGPWSTECSVVRSFEIINRDSFPSIEPLPLTSTEPCSSPSVTMDMPISRACFDDQKIYLQVCNGPLATGAIDSAFLVMTLDSFLIFQSASRPFTQLNPNSYRFELGDIYPNQCITFVVNVKVSCDAVLGQTVCIKSELFPVDTCVFDDSHNTFTTYPVSCHDAYEGSNIQVAGHCMGDSIRFEVSNMTAHNATCYTPVRLYADTELQWSDSIWLNSNEQHIFFVPADGRTYRMEADQHPDHPGLSRPNATIERCGDLMNWRSGLVNAFYRDDADPIVDIYCTEVIRSKDPNDKTGFPLGITNDHLVLPNQLMEYRIRFQNTGTDTAFTVVILDTLDTDLNIFSVVPGVTSQPSSFRMYGSRILEWRFDNILLPDSTTNELESHGFVDFQVQQNPNLQNGTILSNHAGIYFDFNEPVMTNTTWHVIDDRIQGVISSIPGEVQTASQVYAFPNPASGLVHLAVNTEFPYVDIGVYNIAGQLIYQNHYSSNGIIELELNHSGLYFLRVRMGNHIETLKVIIQ